VYRGLCEEPITCLEESTDCGVFKCDPGTSKRTSRPSSAVELCEKRKRFCWRI
jgi:hypothetical protein